MGKGEMIGRVVSNRMQKTVLVAFDRLLWNSKLKVHEKRSSKIMAHDEGQQCDIGDVVKIEPLYRKLSKHKSHMVKEVVKKVSVFSAGTAAQLAADFDSRPKAGDTIAGAKAEVDAAAARLQAARKLMADFLGKQGKQAESTAS